MLLFFIVILPKFVTATFVVFTSQLVIFILPVLFTFDILLSIISISLLLLTLVIVELIAFIVPALLIYFVSPPVILEDPF